MKNQKLISMYVNFLIFQLFTSYVISKLNFNIIQKYFGNYCGDYLFRLSYNIDCVEKWEKIDLFVPYYKENYFMFYISCLNL